MSQESLPRTTSLTSLRENGLFTGEEITIKFVGEEQILAVLVESEDEGDKNSSSPMAAATESDLTSHPANVGDEITESPPKTVEEEPITALPPHEIDVNNAEECGDEGVNAILIENLHPTPSSDASSSDAASSDEREHNIRHCIATAAATHAAEATRSMPDRQASSTSSKYEAAAPLSSRGGKRISQIKRSIARKMNRAAFRMKAAVSRNASDAKTEGTVGSGGEENDCHSHDETGEAFPVTALSPPSEHSLPSTATNQPSLPTNDADIEIERTDSIEYDIIHTSRQTRHFQPAHSTEQIDPTYAGPYDDNKSLVTYSTGDFDMSQMYSRSWSTIAHSIAPSKFVWNRSASRRSWSGNGPIGEETVLDLSVPSVAGRVECPWNAEKEEEEECVSLDGLSLINSIVGDDRSYVEDY